MSSGSRTGGMPGGGSSRAAALWACEDPVSAGLEPQPDATAARAITASAIECLGKVLRGIWIWKYDRRGNKGVVKIVSPSHPSVSLGAHKRHAARQLPAHGGPPGAERLRSGSRQLPVDDRRRIERLFKWHFSSLAGKAWLQASKN